MISLWFSHQNKYSAIFISLLIPNEEKELSYLVSLTESGVLWKISYKNK